MNTRPSAVLPSSQAAFHDSRLLQGGSEANSVCFAQDPATRAPGAQLINRRTQHQTPVIVVNQRCAVVSSLPLRSVVALKPKAHRKISPESQEAFLAESSLFWRKISLRDPRLRLFPMWLCGESGKQELTAEVTVQSEPLDHSHWESSRSLPLSDC
ncbi:predicted protein [Histoplasma capsulatum var. duboisii H88]|uniref:Predicted protein n=1 Tax=Ajellomyces capsulatus (strain H88) TaxID=544711 RepID=F0UIC5_AJEC8|nr:predicted protein [Histoplasma capsulatum var. duboisii H88]